MSKKNTVEFQVFTVLILTRREVLNRKYIMEAFTKLVKYNKYIEIAYMQLNVFKLICMGLQRNCELPVSYFNIEKYANILRLLELITERWLKNCCNKYFQ